MEFCSLKCYWDQRWVVQGWLVSSAILRDTASFTPVVLKLLTWSKVICSGSHSQDMTELLFEPRFSSSKSHILCLTCVTSDGWVSGIRVYGDRGCKQVGFPKKQKARDRWLPGIQAVPARPMVEWGRLSSWETVGRESQRNWNSRQEWKMKPSHYYSTCFAWPHYVNRTVFVFIANFEIFEAYRNYRKCYNTYNPLTRLFCLK